MPKKKASKKPRPELPPELISQVMAAMGSKGGKVRGLSKARTSEQATAAINARWAKQRQAEEQAKAADDPPSAS